MQLGRVEGTVTATIKSEGLTGIKLLIVQPLTRALEPDGEWLVCADATAQAGPGELIYFIGGREAAVALPEEFVPVDHAIVGIVDQISELEG
jgi:ethanolamine utilization protein EutN